MKFSALIRGLGLGLLLTTQAASADSAPPAVQLMGSFVSVKPSAVGAEGGVSLLFHLVEDRELLVGPKVSFLAAHGDNQTRLDLNTGVEGTLWLVNAIGPGLALDLVAPSSITDEGTSVHFRMEPNLAVRVKRFQEEGAWAIRIGVPYDSHYKWGIQAGLTLQISGVPVIGDVARIYSE